MKIHRDLIQRTDEWHKAKAGKISASKVSALMPKTGLGKGASTYALELISERLTGYGTETPTTLAMQQGIDREPYAFEIYMDSNPEKLVSMVGGIESDDGLWYSPDGLVDDDGLIEIKCPGRTQHLRILMSEEVLPEYIHQLQFGLMVSQRDWIDFISFNPDFKDKLASKVICVYPDEQYQNLIKERIRHFNSLLDSFLSIINE